MFHLKEQYQFPDVYFVFQAFLTKRISHAHQLGAIVIFFTNFNIRMSSDLILVCTVLCE